LYSRRFELSGMLPLIAARPAGGCWRVPQLHSEPSSRWNGCTHETSW